MEEKNSNKTKSGAALYIVLILLLIIALGVVYYLGFVKNNDRINELLGKIDDLNAQIHITKENNKKTNNDTTNQEIICELNPEVVVRKISKASNNKYLITADYNVPIEITEEEYEELVETGDCEKYIGFVGTYSKQSKAYPIEDGYGFVILESQDNDETTKYEATEITYQIVKTKTGFSFIFPAGPGWPMCKTITQVEFYMEGSNVIDIENEGEKTLNEYAETLNERLSSKYKPFITVEYNDDEIYLFESAK